MRLLLILLVIAEITYDLSFFVAALGVKLELMLELREDVLYLSLRELAGRRILLIFIVFVNLGCPNLEDMLVIDGALDVISYLIAVYSVLITLADFIIFEHLNSLTCRIVDVLYSFLIKEALLY